MAHLIGALFTDSKLAGEAVAELKKSNFVTDISLIHKDAQSGEIRDHAPEKNTSSGAASGAVAGGAIGALAVALAAAGTLAMPGLGALVVAGPLATLWGVAGGTAIGALTGGLVGALVQAGFKENEAKYYEDRIRAGDTLVAVSTDEENRSETLAVLEKHGGMIHIMKEDE